MDLTAIIVACIVAVPTILATTLVPLWIERNKNLVRQRERQEDKHAMAEAARRAERVAIHAQNAARLLAVNTAETARATQILTEKVDVVHTLVNSNLTAATQKLRRAKADKLALLRLHEPRKIAEIEALRLEVQELDSILAERLIQQDKADKN